jgi:hypothetical protein
VRVVRRRRGSGPVRPPFSGQTYRDSAVSTVHESGWDAQQQLRRFNGYLAHPDFSYLSPLQAVTGCRMEWGEAESATVSGAFSRGRLGRRGQQLMQGEPRGNPETCPGPESGADAQEHRRHLSGSLAPLGFSYLSSQQAETRYEL